MAHSPFRESFVETQNILVKCNLKVLMCLLKSIHFTIYHSTYGKNNPAHLFLQVLLSLSRALVYIFQHFSSLPLIFLLILLLLQGYGTQAWTPWDGQRLVFNMNIFLMHLEVLEV